MHLKLKLGLASALDKAGLITALRKYRSSRSGIILTFHRVLRKDDINACYERQIAMTDSVFEGLLSLLHREFRVVTLQQLIENPEGLDGRQRVALTFDDGWEDTYSVAYPLMLRYGTPATIFLCTALTGTEQMLPEERFARIWRSCAAREQSQLLLKDLQKWGAGSSGSLDMHSWSRRLKRLPFDAKHMMLSHLEDAYRVPQDNSRRFMNWEEALVMSQNGMTFGSHTVHHSTLKSELPATILKDLIESRRLIAAKLGRPTTLLAYPNGSYDERVMELAAEAGYLHAFTTEYGYYHRKTRALAVPRLSMADSVVADQDTALHAPRTRLYLQRFPGHSAQVQPA